MNAVPPLSKDDTTLALDGVWQGYGRHHVLKDISLELAPGVTALVGPNGAGKTTLIRTLATVLPPRKGLVSVHGSGIHSGRAARDARRHIGYLPQGFDADPSFTVRDVVTYAGWLRGLPARELDGAAQEALARIELEDRATSRVRKLSGGMRQRVGIACSVVGNPSIIILDEPTAGLDPEQRMAFRSLLTALNEFTVLLSTHLIEDVAALADRVLLLEQGVIRFDGSLDALRSYGQEGVSDARALEEAYLALTRPL